MILAPGLGRVITLRAAIWRANFPRHVRARITGRITVIYSLTIAAVAAGIGAAMSWWPDLALLFPLAGLFGLWPPGATSAPGFAWARACGRSEIRPAPEPGRRPVSGRRRSGP
jgi:hypothetical protein